MNESTLKLKTPDEAESVFYEAFMRCDADMMAELWANGDVICIHPSSGAIVGYEKVVRSWRQILANAIPPQITFTIVKRNISNDLAVSLVLEEISTDDGDSAMVLATNVYQKFDHGWLMVEHHGSLVQAPPQQHTLQ